MKRLAYFVLVFSFVVILCGCSSINATQQTNPIIVTHESTAIEEPTSAQTEDVQITGQYPFLLGTMQEDGSVQMNYILWSVTNGRLSNSEPWYNQTCDSALDVLVSHWDGGSTIHLLADADAVTPAVQIVNPKEHLVYYGKCAYSSGNLYEIDSDGKICEIPLPADPGEVYDRALLSPTPHYATTDQNVGIVAYMVNDSSTMEADLVYCTYDLSAPENAVWNTVHIPLEYAVDAYVQWNFAYGEETLYIAAFQAILAIDINSGAMRVLDMTNTFAPVWDLYPDATQSSDNFNEPLVISGCWENTLMIEFPITAADGTYNYFYVAVQNDSILGAMAKHDGGVLTFYNANMQQIETDNRYQDLVAPLSIQFPRTD